jgi:hypothetical protein
VIEMLSFQHGPQPWLETAGGTAVVRIPEGGYPLYSPRPYRLWFAFCLPEIWVNDPVTGNRIDGHSLLRQVQEKFASTL